MEAEVNRREALEEQLAAKERECEELRSRLEFYQGLAKERHDREVQTIARAEAAEKALADNSELLTITHMDGYHKGQKSCEARAKRAEAMWDKLAALVNPPGALAAVQKAEAALADERAKHQRVMEWIRGRCECCFDGVNETEKADEPCKSCRNGTNWTPPQAWEGE